MSKEEPVSAYQVYKAAKDMAGPSKKSKQKQNGSANRKNTAKSKQKKSTRGAPSNTQGKNAGKKMTTLSNASESSLEKSPAISNKNKNTNGKKSQEKQAAEADKNSPASKELEIVNLVEQLYSHGSKTLTRSEQKNKKQLEDYLIEQLDIDNIEGFDTVGLGEEESYTEYDLNSDVYTEGESASSNESDNQLAMALPEPKTNKKRKSPEMEQTKIKSNTSATNLGAKKTKISENFNKSVIGAEKQRRRRTSLASADETDKLSTSKIASNNNDSAIANVKLGALSPPNNVVKLNSIEEGKRAFQWLLNPVKVDVFFKKYWEQEACFIQRQQNNYFGHLISFESIDQMMLENHIEFTKNIDVTSYKNGVRETLNPVGRALPPDVWEHYGQGCSIRLINPQTFMPAIFTLSTTMQEYFHCLVGANAYLTPPNSQGFAPHYDDIEAFVLQIEGRKRWKLYKPRSTSEWLPRYSSKNFTQEEIGKPIFDQVLEPGDILYFPRGTIHQASTEPGYHSLHITFSVYQKQSYADLFEKMIPLMLQKTIAASVELRRGLPLHIWQHAGLAYGDSSTKERSDLTKKITQLMQKFMRDLPLQEIIDAGVDQLAKKFQHEALPPEILPAEKLRTVFGSRSRTNDRGECLCDYDIDERTNVRLLRANILRLVEEEDKIFIYYYLGNSKECCEYEANFIEIDPIEAASVEVLIKSYPQYVGVSQLPLSSDEQKISMVTALWEIGLLMMEKPFR